MIYYCLYYTGHTAEGKKVYGFGELRIFADALDEKGFFTSEGLAAAKELFEHEASKGMNATVTCDTITLTAVKENNRVVFEYPCGAGKPLYDSSWRDPRYIGAVKP